MFLPKRFNWNTLGYQELDVTPEAFNIDTIVVVEMNSGIADIVQPQPALFEPELDGEKQASPSISRGKFALTTYSGTQTKQAIQNLLDEDETGMLPVSFYVVGYCSVTFDFPMQMLLCEPVLITGRRPIDYYSVDSSADGSSTGSVVARLGGSRFHRT